MLLKTISGVYIISPQRQQAKNKKNTKKRLNILQINIFILHLKRKVQQTTFFCLQNHYYIF